jgi:hypothetical protein
MLKGLEIVFYFEILRLPFTFNFLHCPIGFYCFPPPVSCLQSPDGGLLFAVCRLPFHISLRTPAIQGDSLEKAAGGVGRTDYP